MWPTTDTLSCVRADVFSRASRMLRGATQVVRMPACMFVCGNFFSEQPTPHPPARRRDNIPLGILVLLKAVCTKALYILVHERCTDNDESPSPQSVQNLG